MTPADTAALLAALVVVGVVTAGAGLAGSARRRDRELLDWWVDERARVIEELEHLANVTEYLAAQAQALVFPFAGDAATAMAVAARQEGCSDAYRTAADMVRGLAVPRS